MGKQRLARLSGVTEPHRHTSQKGDQRGFKSILRQQREIKLSSSPLANLRNYRKRILPVVDEHVVDEIGFGEDSLGAGTNCERDVCVRQHSPESAQRGHSHH